MTIIITPEAQEILSANKVWEKPDATMIDAVDFGDMAYCLAGPFNEKYGLVYITDHSADAEPLEQIIEKNRRSCFTSTSFMPHHVRNRIERLVGNQKDDYYYSEFWYNKDTKEVLSDFDISAGADATGYELDETICTVFFRSDIGLAKVKSFLTDKEYEEWVAAVDGYMVTCIRELENSYPCSDLPFLVRVQGTDDCSYSKTYRSFDDCVEALSKMKRYGFDYVTSEMTFTN